jgi:hypothetical protein
MWFICSNATGYSSTLVHDADDPKRTSVVMRVSLLVSLSQSTARMQRIMWKRGSTNHSILSMTLFSYRTIQFSGTSQAATPQPINVKLCRIDYSVSLPDMLEMVGNRLAEGGRTDR